jgi:hypothetical protein
MLMVLRVALSSALLEDVLASSHTAHRHNQTARVFDIDPDIDPDAWRNPTRCLRPDGTRSPCGPGNEECGAPFTERSPSGYGTAPRYHVMDRSCEMNDPNGAKSRVEYVCLSLPDSGAP